MKDNRTDDDKKWIKLIERCPEDTQEYIKDLLYELWLCYEWMSKKEELAIVKNQFRSKESVYQHFHCLLNDRWLYKKLNKGKKKK